MSHTTPTDPGTEGLYRTLFNSIDQGFCLIEICLDDAGAPVDYRFIDANAVFEQQTGLRNAVGRTARELVPNLEPHWFEIYGRVAATGEPKRFVDHAPSMGRWFDVYAFRIGATPAARWRSSSPTSPSSVARRRTWPFSPGSAASSRAPPVLTMCGGWWRRARRPISRSAAARCSNFMATSRTSSSGMRGATASVCARPARTASHTSSVDPALRAQPFTDVVIVDDTAADPRVDAAAAAALGIGAFASVPLRDGGGRLAFVVGAAAPRTWRPVEIELLRELSTRLSLRIERGRAERAVRESEERFRGLADQAPVLIWLTDAQHQAVFINAEYERFLGRPMPQLLGGGWIEGVHPDDVDPYYAGFVAAADRQERFESDFRFRRADGQYRWMRTVGVPRFDGETFLGYIGSTSDIHERKLAEDAIRESEERFRNMADHAPVMIWVTEPDGYCSYLNSQWFAFTGQSPSEALGFGWLEATHPDDRERSEQAFLAANAARAPFSLEYRLRRRDGHYAWAIDSAAPRFGPDGEYLGYIGSVLDITERREREAELRAANQLKDEFLATLSHELRTPLNAVVGWAHMLRSEGLRPDIRERALESLERNARAQAQIVDDLLDVSRIVSGKLHIADQAVDVGAVVASAIETVKPAADREAGGAAAGVVAAGRGSGHGRRGSPAPGRVEPAVERGEVHAVRRPRRCHRPSLERRRHPRGAGYRRGDPGRLPAVRLRTVPPGRRQRDPASRRAGAWPRRSSATSSKRTAARRRRPAKAPGMAPCSR